MSDLTAKMHGVASFNIAALIRQFDTSTDTTVTGSLSSLLGEIILLEALSHSLTAVGHTVIMLPGRPIRDDTAFGANYPRPRFRDLDAWLLLDDSQLVAVECKHRTAASIDGATVPDEPEQLTAYARRRWTTLKTDHIDTRRMDGPQQGLPAAAPAGKPRYGCCCPYHAAAAESPGDLETDLV